MAAMQLTRTHRILIGVVIAGAVVIAAIGFAGSYTAVRDLAEKKGFGDFSLVFPIGIDAGICVLLALDLLLTWIRIPFPLLRQTAWLLTAATIAFNGAAAWPDPLGVGMHAVIPVLFVVTVEAARHAVGRIADITADKHMEGVRLTRWLLSPVPTFRLWRRMKLWELRSYEQVIKLEQDRMIYQARLQARFGRGWRRKAPVEALMPLRLARIGVPLAETAPAGLAAAGIEPVLLPPTPVAAGTTVTVETVKTDAAVAAVAAGPAGAAGELPRQATPQRPDRQPEPHPETAAGSDQDAPEDPGPQAVRDRADAPAPHGHAPDAPQADGPPTGQSPEPDVETGPAGGTARTRAEGAAQAGAPEQPQATVQGEQDTEAARLAAQPLGRQRPYAQPHPRQFRPQPPVQPQTPADAAAEADAVYAADAPHAQVSGPDAPQAPGAPHPAPQGYPQPGFPQPQYGPPGYGQEHPAYGLEHGHIGASAEDQAQAQAQAQQVPNTHHSPWFAAPKVAPDTYTGTYAPTPQEAAAAEGAADAAEGDGEEDTDPSGTQEFADLAYDVFRTYARQNGNWPSTDVLDIHLTDAYGVSHPRSAALLRRLLPEFKNRYQAELEAEHIA
ncbi:DUF2637 domain-containing protein [Streptomyces sp. CC210A]|uniref:DUF2637 domain-containing protein n=1 Tax=Streptomyces sp. CC210A TaxID=2898184 RepID=UPI001F3EB2CB|nr:DUF2637 domain-containing protein [Streptomyces sp. CC210A]